MPVTTTSSVNATTAVRVLPNRKTVPEEGSKSIDREILLKEWPRSSEETVGVCSLTSDIECRHGGVSRHVPDHVVGGFGGVNSTLIISPAGTRHGTCTVVARLSLILPTEMVTAAGVGDTPEPGHRVPRRAGPNREHAGRGGVHVHDPLAPVDGQRLAGHARVHHPRGHAVHPPPRIRRAGAHAAKIVVSDLRYRSPRRDGGPVGEGERVGEDFDAIGVEVARLHRIAEPKLGATAGAQFLELGATVGERETRPSRYAGRSGNRASPRRSRSPPRSSVNLTITVRVVPMPFGLNASLSEDESGARPF